MPLDHEATEAASAIYGFRNPSVLVGAEGYFGQLKKPRLSPSFPPSHKIGFRLGLDRAKGLKENWKYSRILHKKQWNARPHDVTPSVCDYCDSNSLDKKHPPEYAVDGAETWWQSPPLSRGSKYNEVNLTIDLGQIQKSLARSPVLPIFFCEVLSLERNQTQPREDKMRKYLNEKEFLVTGPEVPGFISGASIFLCEAVGLERGQLILVRTNEEILERRRSSPGIEN
uniref:Laminin N-terminal domain-containing protein n=1 Tax=Timema bartmani TaxID=61472 RepID=A0A7R9HY90_9NEOP|nr:unnamed protein product [Timema bartmani]